MDPFQMHTTWVCCFPRHQLGQLMHIIEPEGIENRMRRRLKRRTGLNAMWHIDGYDKLARYGIYIHGCVDGYSRKIIWLHAYYTNKDPKVTAGYFMDVITENHKCPQRVRLDRGTENGDIEQMQKFLRREHTVRFEGDRSGIYGTSVHNQRIEWMWGLIRRQDIEFWINFMQQTTEEDMFLGDFVDKNILRFCFCAKPGQTYGYRWIHSKCIQHGFVVSQDTVRQLVHIIDPEGIENRMRRRLKRRRYVNPGPNAMWHIDGYDKLARYGIYIHGCFDGYSRKIIWLHAY
ncbi:hypothetical protein KUTeg_009591 [Tegillarca granosa]|uniref:Integrase core domain-containing protein n=1 Tax=Tegillarca granosa TaxID=220873 RepID=A0ABQ9F4B8_TEGGR|nr:hypothetical protein KUTeg_009591 [Tegillarca granosa]